jgi:hypothetical protein
MRGRCLRWVKTYRPRNQTPNLPLKADIRRNSGRPEKRQSRHETTVLAAEPARLGHRGVRKDPMGFRRAPRYSSSVSITPREVSHAADLY